ncbi:hypothetical protein [Deinococcus sp. NW-56]|uniref:hypothetical protein n=1 Tax=Deinococcus sp. NW-56 TaxID=2080419 RepID=UPI000CF491F7|nr:hypothetical protein [Deinococcus sp. NW-56]
MRSLPPRIRLSTEPQFMELMDQLTRTMKREGRRPKFTAYGGHTHDLPLDPRAYTFEDHGAAGHRNCAACRVDRQRRFALFVETPQGSLGPVGSTCLFERVLGLRPQEAQRLARLLEQVAREAAHREGHRSLLRGHPSHVLYLRALGLEWTRDAQLLARAPLTHAQRQALRAWNLAPLSALPLRLFEVLTALTPSSRSADLAAQAPGSLAAEPARAGTTITISERNRAARLGRAALERRKDLGKARTHLPEGGMRPLTEGDLDILRFVLSRPLPEEDRSLFEALQQAGQTSRADWQRVLRAQTASKARPSETQAGHQLLAELGAWLPRQFHAQVSFLQNPRAPGINPKLKAAIDLAEAARDKRQPAVSPEDVETRAHQLAALQVGFCHPLAHFGPWRRYLKTHLRHAPLTSAMAALVGLDSTAEERRQNITQRAELLQVTLRWTLELTQQHDLLRWYVRDPEGVLARSVFVAEHYARTGELHARTLRWLRTLAEQDGHPVAT